MLNIGVAGCSHSGGSYGNPWSYYMKQNLSCEVTDVTSPGVGNEMMIEKIKKTLETKNTHHQVDFYIYQIIEPSRLVLGLYGNDPKEEYQKYYASLKYNDNSINCFRQTNNISYITLQNSVNNDDINRLVGKNYNVADFFRNHIIVSDFNMKIKVFHTLMAIQNLFNFYNKKVLFFSWSVDIKQLAKEVGYEPIINSMYILDGSVESFAGERKIPTISGFNLHYGSESQKIIYEEFLHKNIVDFINNKL
tara:strand:- start:2932 stop:3678 length:747 start_codon:yes stop_codon:yes gene_type:complete